MAGPDGALSDMEPARPHGRPIHPKPAHSYGHTAHRHTSHHSQSAPYRRGTQIDVADALITNLGAVILLITVLGYISNWLNWRFLNYSVTHLLYYVGAFVHESSHAILCILTGARIEEFRVFSRQPHVVSTESRLPFIGEVLINIAPIIGGLSFLFLINTYILKGYFVIPQFTAWSSIPHASWALLSQINLLEWQSWVMLLLFVNVGAMLGPSFRDLRNIWAALIVLCFIHSPLLAALGLLAVSLIAINIIIQGALILVIALISRAY